HASPAAYPIGICGDGCGRDYRGTAEGAASISSAAATTVAASGTLFAEAGESIPRSHIWRGLAVRIDFPSAELAGHDCFASDPGKRKAGWRRLRHNAVAAGERPGYTRRGGAGQRVSHKSLHWPQRTQGQ